MSETNTQLTSADGYDTSRMIFSEASCGTIPDSKPQINYYRINIATRNEDGSVGELIIPTEPNLFSFGVSENVSPDTGKVNGYVLPICLYNRDGATDAQRVWVETYDRICETAKDHIMNVKEEIAQYDLERTDLKKLNNLHYKKEKGKIVPGTGPTLYGKLIVKKAKKDSGDEDKIITMFFDFENNSIRALDLLGKYGHVNAAIKVESIFIGNKISLQVKLYECEFKPSESGMKRLLQRPVASSRVLTQAVVSATSPNPLVGDDSDDGSLNGGDDNEGEDKKEDVVESPAPRKKLVRKVKKVVRPAGTD